MLDSSSWALHQVTWAKILPTGFPHIFKNYFPFFFNTKLKDFNTIIELHFSRILLMEHNAKNICRTVISGNKQNLNKQIVEFRIFILFQYFMYVLAIFNTFSWSWKLISKFNIFSIPRGNQNPVPNYEPATKQLNPKTNFLKSRFEHLPSLLTAWTAL